MKTVIELAKEVWHEDVSTMDLKNLERFAALVRTEREWVDLTADDLNEIETKICPHVDSHDFELIGNAYIAAFKEKNK